MRTPAIRRGKDIGPKIETSRADARHDLPSAARSPEAIGTDEGAVPDTGDELAGIPERRFDVICDVLDPKTLKTLTS